MSKIYNILLNKQKIGATAFEKADAPMGVVFGEIIFNDDIKSGYAFFKDYCSKNRIKCTDLKEDKIILLHDIPGLSIVNPGGRLIKGEACSISATDTDGSEIYLEGIPEKQYEEEFPHHVKEYRGQQ